MKEFVVLVDQDDQKLGLMEKQQAHVAGLLHRAFSVFVFNSNGELMIQQRAASKYHSPTLWTNTCCSHPRDNETYEQAAHRRALLDRPDPVHETGSGGDRAGGGLQVLSAG